MSPPHIRFQTVSGRVYTVEYDDNLVIAPDWQILTDNIQHDPDEMAAIEDSSSSTQRSYRIKVRLAP
jgi:hypothetical protein